MLELKPFLVDVPVKVNIWIRYECLREQFEVLKKARPSILFIQSDGGRNEKEWDAINKGRAMFDNEIDWDCTVYKFYEEVNNGLYAMSKKVTTFLWEKVDRCIYLEDDIIPSVSFFRYCAELLEKYKDDQRIECVCGMNHLGVYEDVNTDYFFSRQGSIWGIATWRREAITRGDFTYGQDEYVMKNLKKHTKKNKMAWNRIDAYSKQKYYEGHVAGGEFWHEFNMYAQNRLQIIPKYNMISNIGAGKDSAHMDELKKFPRGFRRVFNMKTYEIEFPLNHAKYVFNDEKYEKKRNRIMAYNAPWTKFVRRIERFFILLRYGDLFKVIKKKFKKRKIEK